MVIICEDFKGTIVMYYAARRPAFGRLLAARCCTAVNSQYSEIYRKQNLKYESNMSLHKIFPTQKKVLGGICNVDCHCTLCNMIIDE